MIKILNATIISCSGEYWYKNYVGKKIKCFLSDEDDDFDYGCITKIDNSHFSGIREEYFIYGWIVEKDLKIVNRKEKFERLLKNEI